MNLKNKLYGELLSLEKEIKELQKRRLEVKRLLNLPNKQNYRKTTSYNQK